MKLSCAPTQGILSALSRFFFLLCLVTVVAFPAALRAQTFEPLGAVSFTMPVGGANPLPQTLTPLSTGAAFNFTGVASTTTGGSWLSFSTNFGYGLPTGSPATVVVTAPESLAAGTYEGKLVFTSASNSAVTVTVPVSLVVAPTTAAFPGNLPGELSFSLATAGKTPPGQSFQISNAGAGTLDWTITKSYSSGSGWLTISAASGTGAATVLATISPSALPGGGLIAGSYAAELTVKGAGGEITIPIVVVVGNAVFRQLNPLNFVKEYGGANPLPQMMTVASTGTNFTMFAKAVNSTGGTWLQISPSNYGYGLSTPQAVSVSVNPIVDLPVGTYTDEIEVYSVSGALGMMVPVTLTVVPSTDAFFDDLSGAIDFTMVTGGTAPPGQAFSIRNAGSGTLSWTLSGSTSDGGNWLGVSAGSGTAPSTVTVTVVPENLPGAGEEAGSYTGQLILQTASGRVTIPITFVVGASEFQQVNPITFSKTYAGANPLPQVFTVASTGSRLTIYASVENSTGGNWLSISPSNYGYGLGTPQSITVTATPAADLAAGSYSAAVLVESLDGTVAMTVPVSLIVSAAGTAHFDDLPGQLSFSMATSGEAPPSQPIQIRNAGSGTLNWTGSTSTSDGGSWLSISASNGTAPSAISAKISPDNLPGGGKTAGTFIGQIVLLASGDRVTIPVTVVVGTTAFRQVDGLNFNMSYGGANPLPQVITAASTGTNFNIYGAAVNSTGGNWLQIAPSNYGYGLPTPQAISVSVSAPADLGPGSYSGEVLLQSTDGTLQIVVPVTLTVSAATATFFDQLPGQLSFSMVTEGKAPPAQAVQIRNAGAGTLEWTGTATTSDGGSWLSLSATSGTAPDTITAKINPADLPGGGLTAGLFTGQVVLATATDRVTIPVSVLVGANVFKQVNGLNFTMTYKGNNPIPQVVPVISTGTNFNIFAAASNSKGGNWLQISPSSYGYGLPTPQIITASVAPASPLPVGTYTSEIFIQSTNGSMSMMVPVTLTVAPSTSTYFDVLPGLLGFSYKTGGTAPPAQTFQVRNAGAGTLNWTLSSSTSDGGSWLSFSATSGTAPESVTVSVVPKNLPGAGLVAGSFTGQIVLQTAGDTVTIPVTVDLGANVFKQISPLSFSKNYGGSNPASQTITVDSTGTAFAFYAIAASGDGGNWLQISPSNYGYGVSTPATVTVSVDAATALAAGVYGAEVLAIAENGSMAITIPVTLTIEGTAHVATPAFFPPGGTYDAAQSVIISDTTPDSSIFYTTDGTTPTTSSATYKGPITVSKTQTVNAIAVAPGYLQSATGKAVYTITAPVPPTPGVSQQITITEALSGATVYYTTNGTTPTTKSTKYTGPITLTSSSILKFIAVAPGYTSSNVRTVTTTIQ